MSGRAGAARLVGIALSILALIWTFRDADPALVKSLLGQVGGAGALILLPQLASLFSEALGWRLAFTQMQRSLPLWGLLRARVATEALAQTLPLGVILSESIKPLLLARGCGADLGTSLAGIAARKWLLVTSQSLYVTAFAIAAWPAMARVAPALPYAMLGAALLLTLLSLAGYALLARGGLTARVHALLCRLPSRSLRERLAPLRERVSRTDGQLLAFFVSLPRRPLALLAFLSAWLFEAVETWLILRLLGVELCWTTIGAVEVAAGLLRSLAFVVPAGLGVQDLGYLTLLRGLGVHDALSVTAAFLLLKRSKECVWAALGYVILALELRPMPLARRAEQAC